MSGLAPVHLLCAHQKRRPSTVMRFCAALSPQENEQPAPSPLPGLEIELGFAEHIKPIFRQIVVSRWASFSIFGRIATCANMPQKYSGASRTEPCLATGLGRKRRLKSCVAGSVRECASSKHGIPTNFPSQRICNCTLHFNGRER